LFGIGDVAGNRARPPPGSLDLLDKCVEKLTPSRYHHNGIAPRGQRHGNLTAEARRGTSHKSHIHRIDTADEVFGGLAQMRSTEIRKSP